jgi:hypothetical protein
MMSMEQISTLLRNCSKDEAPEIKKEKRKFKLEIKSG